MPSVDPTHERLINAAGEIFAERGFRAATVRDICSKAGANIAAVNYYFRDKEGLYVEAFKASQCSLRETLPNDLPADLPGEEKLRIFIRKMLEQLFDNTRPAWHSQLMIRELSHPSPICQPIIEEYIRPLAEILFGILREVLPETSSIVDTQLVAFSVVGQCLYYKVFRPVAEALVGPEQFATLDVSRLTDHIARFSLAALGKEPPLVPPEPTIPTGAAR